METPNRTWLGTVVFLDVISYTQLPVSDQIKVKNNLTQIIQQAISHVAERDRIIMDTGDGAALCFLGDPEDALFAGMNMLDLVKQNRHIRAPQYSLRIGVNLGPVKLIKDINGRQNVLGDGINVAQRVMSFAGPNQMYVSRSFYEVIGCLSTEYAELFDYQGIRKDKHVREHEVYQVKVALDGPPSITEIIPVDTEERPVLQPDSAGRAAPGKPLDSDAVAYAGQLLSEYFGPLGKVLANKTAKSASSVEEFHRKLAAAIDDEAHRNKFLMSVELETEKAPAPGPSAAPAGPAIDEVALHAVELELAKHVGPLAKILVKAASKRTSSKKEIIEILSREISDEISRKQFLDSVH